jgi:membrane-bound PQQ-dependent dehydrogenase (glucose/quinate/shikimate family)
MAARIAQWIFSAFLVLVGGYLAVRGVQLIGLGGSWYYAIVGAGLIAVAALLVLRSPWGPRLYAIILGATVFWAIWEAEGLDLLALLPRLAAFIAVGLWFLTPWHRAAMRAPSDETPRSAGALWVGGATALGAAILAVAAMQPYPAEPFERADASAVEPSSTDWRAYGKTEGGTRFAEVQQVNLDNVKDLEVAWTYRTGVPYDFKMTPLQVGDLLYLCTAGNQLIALDAASGEERWRHDTRTEVPGARNGLADASTFARTCRGLGYYEGQAESTGACARRIITGTTDARLLAVDALTGQSCREFGFDGEVNLKSGLGFNSPGEYMVTSTPLIAGDVAVVGGWVMDNQQIGNVSGVIRAYNVVTGDFVWAWDMGNPGYQGLPEEGGQFTRGTPNVWSNMSYDPELNLIYAPTGNSSPDYYGPKRREFDEAYSAATIAIDAATGQLRWAYQNTHHDIWDYDAPSQPVLVTVTKDGQRIPAVVQPTKRGEIFLLDRRDGTPIWPATTCPDGSATQAGGECPVPQGAVEGDFVTPTQPFSALPHFRPDRWERDMWGLTPLDQLYCRIEYKKMRYEGHFTPPMRGGGDNADLGPTYGGTFQYPGNAGGFNWPSVSVDADNGLLVAQPMLMGNRIVMMSMEELGEARRRAAEAEARRNPPDEHAAASPPSPPRAQGPQRPPYTDQGEWEPGAPRYGDTRPFMSGWAIPFTDITTNLPCFEPPYGRLALIDLNQNRLLWSRPIGTMEEMGPFNIATGLPFNVGTPIYGGTMTTRAGLIFQVGTMDSRIRAIDIRNGKVVWTAKMPGTANSTPITYIAQQNARQYLVVLVPNPGFRYPRMNDLEPIDDQGGFVIAYALPDAAE